MLYLGLWLECWKTMVIFLINALQIVWFQRFVQKLEFLNFEPKNALFNALFKISTLEFALLQRFVQKINILKFGTKNARFPYIGGEIWKYFCHISNQRPRICLLTKFGAKIKIVKFGTKNAWFGLKIILSYLKSAPSNLLNSNFRVKMKMPKFGIKMPYLSTFGLEFENDIVIFEFF